MMMEEDKSRMLVLFFSDRFLQLKLLAALCSAILMTWILIHRWSYRRCQGPSTWPLIGAAIEQLNNYHRMHDWIAGYLSESTTMTVPMPFTTYTYTADPANVEHILKTNFTNYPKGEVYRSYMHVLLGDGIFNVDGVGWKKQRKTASFEFASKNLKDLSTTVFRNYAIKLSTILSQVSQERSRSVDMQDLFMRMTLDSICKVGFGVEIGTLSPELPDNDFARAFDMANMIVTQRFIDPLWKLKKLLGVGSEAILTKSIKVIDEFTYNVIHKRKTEMKVHASKPREKIQHDILSRFIELGDDPEGSDFNNEKSLRDVVLNFVIAGRDTTATTLSWFIYMLITQPKIEEKLNAELKAFEEKRAKEEKITLCATFDNNDSVDMQSFKTRLLQFASLLDYDSLGRLPYLHASITETLRLYPAVPQDPKGILEDDVLPDGTRVKAGGMVTYVPYSMGRMTYNWGSNASCFQPERWLGEVGHVLQNVSPYKFTAFQAGPRMCLGKDSAYLQMKMTLAILCRFFHFRLEPCHPPVHYRMMTILSMEQGLNVLVSTRHS